MTELEQKKFRQGESTGRPFGGNISPEPFPQTLHRLIASRGFESQKSLARALCIRFTTVGAWYRNEHIPTPKLMEGILILLQLNDEESDSLLNPYGQLLEKTSLRYSLASRKPGLTPFCKWVDKYCDDRKITLISLARLLGFKSTDEIKNSQRASLDKFSSVLQKAPEALNLSAEETDVLAEAVATTIEKQMAEGHKFRGNHHLLARKLQEEFPCRTYTPIQASHELGITREGVRYLRNKFGLPILLTEENLEKLRTR